MDWYWGKAEIRQYLEDVNRDKKVCKQCDRLDGLPRLFEELTEHRQVLEYCLFQPGWLTNYFAHPHVSAKHFRSFDTPIDFNNGRALLAAGCETQRITLTTIQDVAQVVTKAVEYGGEWPIVGGIKGTELSIAEFIALGEAFRGESDQYRATLLVPDEYRQTF